MTERRDAADDEPGQLVRLARGGPPHLVLPGHGGEASQVDAVRARDEAEDRLESAGVVRGDEDERLDDLGNLGTDGRRRLFGGVRRVVEDGHLELDALSRSGIEHALDRGGTGGFGHGPDTSIGPAADPWRASCPGDAGRRRGSIGAVKAILFDWDGTLADSIGRLFEANIAVMTSFGLPFDEDVYRRHFSPDWRLMYERLGIPAERIDEANDIWLAAYRSGATTALLAGARDALERLSGAGFRLGLVTAGHRDIVEPLLGRFELAGFFDVAVFGTDMVEQKPDPTPLLVAISRLGGVTAEEAVYLGDTVEDIAMASAAGVRAVGIPSLVGPADALLAAGADEIASSVASWADALLAAMPR